MKFVIPLTLILTFLCAAGALPAQAPPIEWGDIPKSDLQMTVYEADSSADAVVLGDFGEVKFDFTIGDGGYRFERHRRIKILKRSAFDRADIALPFYSYQRKEKIDKLKVQIFSPDGKKETLRKRDIFEEEVNEYWSQLKFTLPKVQEGSVIEYTYTLHSEGFFELPEWYFQEDIPVRWSEYRVHIPEWFHYVTLSQGSRPDISETNTTHESIFVISNGRSGTTEGKVTHHRFAMKDVPAMKEEPYVTTMDDYLARLRFQLSGVQFDTYDPVLTSWEEVAKELMSHGSFGEQLTKTRHHKDILKAVEPIMADAETPTEKLQAAYRFLAKEMEWDGNTSMYVKDDLETCFEQRKGNSGELNLMLIAILQAHGVDAKPMLVSTRSNGKTVQLYPILDQFNHVVAMVPRDGEYIPVDMGSRLRPAGLLRVSSLNRMGWIVDPDKPEWTNIDAPESKSVVMADLQLDASGALSGSLKQYHAGYSAVSARQEFKEHPDGKHLQENLREFNPEAVVDSFRTQHLDDIEETLINDVFCHLPGSAQMAGDFLYFNPVILPSLTENPFKVEKRLFPVDIPYPFNEQYILKLQLPEGYVLEEVPEPIQVSLEGAGAKFDYFVKQAGDSELQVVSRFTLRQTHFEPEEYKGIREIFARFVEKQREQIVLRKKT